jgi:hypothetical protein
MAEENKFNGRWLYSKLRVCGHFIIVEKLYTDWIKTNATLSGFGCEVTGEKSPEKFDKIREFIANHQLPLVFEDATWHRKLFVLTIIKKSDLT